MRGASRSRAAARPARLGWLGRGGPAVCRGGGEAGPRTPSGRVGPGLGRRSLAVRNKSPRGLRVVQASSVTDVAAMGLSRPRPRRKAMLYSRSGEDGPLSNTAGCALAPSGGRAGEEEYHGTLLSEELSNQTL